jgi:lysophospholipase L1-like esterase
MARMKIKRVAVITCVGGLLVAAGIFYVYFWQIFSVGAGPAGPQVPVATFSHTWSERPFLLVGLGDSVTAGFGARKGYSYFGRLVTNPPDEFQEMTGRCLKTVLPHLEITNLAISGSTSGEHVRQELPRLPVPGSNTVALVLITTGGNDIIHNYGRTPPREEAMYGAKWDQAVPWVTNFEARLEGIIETLRARFPGGCHVFLATIFDPTDGVGDIKRAGLPSWEDGLRIVAAYNEVIRRCAQRHPFVHVVDVHDAFLGHGIHCAQFWSARYDARDPHYWYYTNLEDPNERGYDAIRRLFLIEIAKAVGPVN